MRWLTLALAIAFASATPQYTKTVKGGYGGGHQYRAGDNLIKYYNGTQQGYNGYSGGNNLSAQANQDKGVCYIEVPTVNLVKDPSHVPAGNGSRPDLSRIRVCCQGYEKNIHNPRICEPVCTKECVNALCTAPETCTCFPDHVKNLAGYCVPTCPIGCQNGNCAGGECICKDGFKLDSEGRFCVPNCRANCGGIGNCTAPNTCECRSGFKFGPDGSCQPVCDRCSSGQCVAPNDCRCHQGYLKNAHGDCVPQCPNDCKPNGWCIAPNVCSNSPAVLTTTTHLPGQQHQKPTDDSNSTNNVFPYPTIPTNGPTQHSQYDNQHPQYPGNQYPYYPGSQPANYPGNRPSNYPGQQPSNSSVQIPPKYPGYQQSNYTGQVPPNYPGHQPSNYPGQVPPIYPGPQPSNFSGQPPPNYPGQQPPLYPGYQPPNYPNLYPFTYPGYQPYYPGGQPNSFKPSNFSSVQPKNYTNLIPSNYSGPPGPYNPGNQPTYLPGYQPYNPSNQPSFYPGQQPPFYPEQQPSYYPGQQPPNYPGLYPGQQPSLYPNQRPFEGRPIQSYPSYTDNHQTNQQRPLYSDSQHKPNQQLEPNSTHYPGSQPYYPNNPYYPVNQLNPYEQSGNPNYNPYGPYNPDYLRVNQPAGPNQPSSNPNEGHPNNNYINRGDNPDIEQVTIRPNYASAPTKGGVKRVGRSVDILEEKKPLNVAQLLIFEIPDDYID